MDFRLTVIKLLVLVGFLQFTSAKNCNPYRLSHCPRPILKIPTTVNLENRLNNFHFCPQDFVGICVGSEAFVGNFTFSWSEWTGVVGCTCLHQNTILSNSANAQSSSCTSDDEHKGSYLDLNTQMMDASRQEHVMDFVLNTTLGMYKFLHPCISSAKAALELFYTSGTSATTHWEHEMSSILGETPLIGRRRRTNHYTNDDALLKNALNKLVHDTGTDGGCVKELIDRYSHTAATTFKQKYPHFHVPTTPPTTTRTTTTTTTTTTTPKPTTPTTTRAPTTATTTAKTTTTTAAPTHRMTRHRPTTATKTTLKTTPTKASKTTIKTTPKPTTTATTAGSTVTYGPISCTSCNGLMCLVGSHVKACPHGNSFCVTTVTETGKTGRLIDRGCTDQASCDTYNQSQDALCSEVDSKQLPEGTVCRFCCLGDNCNKPPQVTPDASTLYNKH